jgi:hypothetical protein
MPMLLFALLQDWSRFLRWFVRAEPRIVFSEFFEDVGGRVDRAESSVWIVTVEGGYQFRYVSMGVLSFKWLVLSVRLASVSNI